MCSSTLPPGGVRTTNIEVPVPARFAPSKRKAVLLSLKRKSSRSNVAGSVTLVVLRVVPGVLEAVDRLLRVADQQRVLGVRGERRGLRHRSRRRSRRSRSARCLAPRRRAGWRSPRRSSTVPLTAGLASPSRTNAESGIAHRAVVVPAGRARAARSAHAQRRSAPQRVPASASASRTVVNARPAAESVRRPQPYGYSGS